MKGREATRGTREKEGKEGLGRAEKGRVKEDEEGQNSEAEEKASTEGSERVRKGK